MEKNQILKVSEELFFAKKYGDVKLDNIANALDIRKPSLYYYFVDKKDLFLQTLNFSMHNYLEALKEVISQGDFEDFVKRYLVYPGEKKNLFAVAMQKGYCIDSKVNYVLFNGKQNVISLVQEFFGKYGIDEKKTYLIINLLENLAMNNCIENYCLKYSFGEIAQEIRNLLDV